MPALAPVERPLGLWLVGTDLPDAWDELAGLELLSHWYFP